MTTVLVLGAGKIGALVSHMLGTCGDYELRVADADAAAARAAVDPLESGTARELAFDDPRALDEAMRGAAAVVSCAPFHCNPLVAERARENGLHYFDLTEDVSVTERVTALARGAPTAFMPQCGLAPGFISIAAAHLIEGMAEIRDLRMRVGALPRFPSNRLKYNLTWSTEGLINEYLNPCDVLRDGELTKVSPLEHLEHITVDGVEYEAFNTSGGVGTLAATLRGRARNVSYKTIRYPGHNELLKLLFEDLAFGDHRPELKRVLERAVPSTAQDQVVVFVDAIGTLEGRLVERTYANTLLHRDLDGRPWTAIQLTTAAGVCAVVDLLLGGKLPQQGFVRQEQVVWSDFISNRFGRHFARD